MTAPKALVTGARGFIGGRLARLLADSGYEVSGIGRGAWPREEFQAAGLTDWHDGLVDRANLEKFGGEPDVVFHCAGSSSVARSVENPRNDFDCNTVMTLDVLEFIRELNAAKGKICSIVFPSSAGVYGQLESLPISVNASLNPISPYGCHKLMGEMLCRSYARNFGVKAAIVRLFSVYGAGLRKQLLWDACNKLTAGEAVFFGTGEETRDWINVDDAARLMLIAGEQASLESPTCNGGVGQGTAIREIVAKLAQGLGVKTHISFSGNTKAGDPTHFVADIKEALSWGWAPQTNLDKGLLAYTDWYKREKGRA
ncbi:MAG: NAD-dependent epimerase/dehydratase family protein [Pseudomonadota bacterium]